jgi:hypothetical protein
MKNVEIKISKNEDYYSFDILKGDRVILSSSKDYYLVPFVKSSYKYAIDAYKDANKIIKKHTYHLAGLDDLTRTMLTDVSAEDSLVSHYSKIIDLIKERMVGIDKSDKDEYNNIHDEIKNVIRDLEGIKKQIDNVEDKKKIIEQIIRAKGLYRKITKKSDSIDKNIVLASVSDKDLLNNLLEDYGEKICNAIKEKHNGVIYKIIIKDSYSLVIIENEEKSILVIRINNKLLNVDNIFPISEFSLKYPYYSLSFYQRYWKPIIESVGHYYNSDFDILLDVSELPDVPKNSDKIVLSGWNVSDKKSHNILLSFTEDMWIFDNCPENFIKNAEVVSKYTEQDYLNAVVKCIDPELKSIVNRTGSVIQVIPQTDYIEIDVDFGRGIGVIRLTEKQTDIVPLDLENNKGIKTAMTIKDYEDDAKDIEDYLKTTMTQEDYDKYFGKYKIYEEEYKHPEEIEAERIEKEKSEQIKKEKETTEEKEMARLRELMASKN